MRAAKVQARLPEPPLLAHTSSESRGTFRRKARSLAPLNAWACAVKICHDGMLEDTNSLDGAQLIGCFFIIDISAAMMFLCRFSIWALSSEFVSSSIASWQILTAHAHTFRGARNLAFCLKVPLDSLLVWASSEGSCQTARMRRLAWTFAARIGDKYQIACRGPSNSVKLMESMIIYNTLYVLIRQVSNEHKSFIFYQNVPKVPLSPILKLITTWLISKL